MKALIAIARRELFSLWVTPLGWLLLGLFTLLNGAAFVAIVTALSESTQSTIDWGPMQAFYGQSIFVPLGYLVFCPVLTMRSLSEERRQGTAETLLSTQATSTSIVFGKYLALAVSYLILWLPSLLYPFILRNTGHVEWTVVLSSYLGVLGLGLGFVAVGEFASSITTNQLVAAALSSALILLFILAGVAEQLLVDSPLRPIFLSFSVQAHLTEAAQGIISLRRLVHAATIILLPLFLAVRAVERWREP
jgi:ABC-2 type transport system permease protein